MRVKPRRRNLRCSFLRVAADGAAMGEGAGSGEERVWRESGVGVWERWRDNNWRFLGFSPVFILASLKGPEPTQTTIQWGWAWDVSK